MNGGQDPEGAVAPYVDGYGWDTAGGLLADRRAPGILYRLGPRPLSSALTAWACRRIPLLY